MKKFKALLMTATVVASGVVFAAPASASCHQLWVGGPCIENVVCGVVNKVRPTPCVD